jgi:hypothetical protein
MRGLVVIFVFGVIPSVIGSENDAHLEFVLQFDNIAARTGTSLARELHISPGTVQRRVTLIDGKLAAY